MNKKVKKKPQIFEYYASSPKKSIKTICEQSINEKKHLTKQQIEEKIEKSMKCD